MDQSITESVTRITIGHRQSYYSQARDVRQSSSYPVGISSSSCWTLFWRSVKIHLHGAAFFDTDAGSWNQSSEGTGTCTANIIAAYNLTCWTFWNECCHSPEVAWIVVWIVWLIQLKHMSLRLLENVKYSNSWQFVKSKLTFPAWISINAHTTSISVSIISTWWRHQMETLSALLAICAGNSPVPGEFPTQRLVTRSFDVYFDLRPDKRLGKQS